VVQRRGWLYLPETEYAFAVTALNRQGIESEKHETFRRAANYRLEDVFTHVDEAIAMAVMYVANHLDVTAIIALTESGSTPLWMSRVRSDIPVFAFTRHEATLRRVSLYRGVYAVAFEEVVTDDVAATQARMSPRTFAAGAAKATRRRRSQYRRAR
jgi:pyruvate kinase